MTKITVIKGDITLQDVDAIVNAANQSLRGVCGITAAIHTAAGPKLLEACDRLGGCDSGKAKITQGYNLPAKYVIHTVGPVYGYEDGREAELLEECYTNCLNLAKEQGIRSIAFPAIATGGFGYPIEEATKIAVQVAKSFIQANPDVLEEIRFVTFNNEDYNVYKVYG